MSDPYRTPAVVETDEQRLERLRIVYECHALSNTPTTEPERSQAFAEYRKAADAYFAELRRQGK